MLAKKKEIKKRKRKEVGDDGSGDDMEVDEERIKRVGKKRKRGTMERESEGNAGDKVLGKDTKKVGLKGRGPLAPHLLQVRQYDRDLDGDVEMEEASVKEKNSHLKRVRVVATETKESISPKKQSIGTSAVISKSGKKNKQSKAETDTAAPKKTPTSAHTDSFFEAAQEPSKLTPTQPNSPIPTPKAATIISPIAPQTTTTAIPAPPDPAPSAQTFLRSGVVAVIDHTKKASAKGSKAGTRPMRAQVDITAVLETEARKRTLLGDGDPEDGGTGLGVDQWD